MVVVVVKVQRRASRVAINMLTKALMKISRVLTQELGKSKLRIDCVDT
jgi:hypothetical protein